MIKYLIFGSGTSFVFSFFLLVFLARSFPLEFISDVKAITIYGGWFALVFNAQVHTALLYFLNKSDTPTSSIRVFALTYLLAAAILCGWIFTLSFPLIYHSIGIQPWGMAAFGVVAGLNLLFGVSSTVFTAHGSSSRIPLLVLTYSFASFIALISTYLFQLDVNSYAVVLAVLSFLSIMFSEWKDYLIFSIQNIRSLQKSYYPPFVKYAARMSLALFLETIGERLDKVLASRFLSQVAFAKYSVLCFENPLVNLLLSSYGISLIKEYQDGTNGREKEFLDAWVSMIRNVSFITFPISIFLIANNQWFISTVFGERFIDASGVFTIYLSVALVRFAPFQSLLRLEGVAHYNLIISSLFFIVALSTSTTVILLGLNLELLALSYLAAWIVFNGFAVYLFTRITHIIWSEIVVFRTWTARMAQCLIAVGVSDSVSLDNMHLRLPTYCVTYLLISLYFEPEIRVTIVAQIRQLIHFAHNKKARE